MTTPPHPDQPLLGMVCPACRKPGIPDGDGAMADSFTTDCGCTPDQVMDAVADLREQARDRTWKAPWKWLALGASAMAYGQLQSMFPIPGSDNGWETNSHTIRTWIEPHPGRPPERLRFAVSQKHRTIWVAPYIPRLGVQRRMERAAEELDV